MDLKERLAARQLGLNGFSVKAVALAMDFMPAPDSWTPRQWLTFLLLMAADADGQLEVHEMRHLRVAMGNETVDAMKAWLLGLSGPSRDQILRETLPHFVQSVKSREKLQRMLRDMFMADGEYGPAEQAVTKKIGDWLRAASQN
jgi:uncharacterized tellurite resistance protein B-like protein